MKAKLLFTAVLVISLFSGSFATNSAMLAGSGLLSVLTSSNQANSVESDYTWLRLFGMWHDQLTPTGYGLGAGAKIDPSPHVTLAIDAEVRLQRDNLSDNSNSVGNDLGFVIPLSLQYSVMSDHRSRWQPYLIAGGYYTTSNRGGDGVGFLTATGLAFNFGTEVLALDFRYYSDTYLSDSPKSNHYAIRFSLWFMKPEPKKQYIPSRSTASTSPSSGQTTDSRSGKTRY